MLLVSWKSPSHSLQIRHRTGFAQKILGGHRPPLQLGCATVGALYERPRCIFWCKAGNMSGSAQERPEFGEDFLRHLLGHKVAARQSPAFRLHSFLFPKINGIPESRRTIPAFGP